MADGEASSPSGGSMERSDDDLGQQLVAAAAEVFAERGFEGTRVQEIAARAGLTTGAIYGRFRGKTDLLHVAIREHTVGLISRVERESTTVASPAEVLSGIGRGLFDLAHDGDQALLVEALIAARREPEVAEITRAAMSDRAARLIALIDAGREAGLIDKAIPDDAIVRFLHSVLIGSMVLSGAGIDEPDAAGWADLVDRQIAALAPRDL